jgi:WhiB family redox-sensing transcriptional regulator
MADALCAQVDTELFFPEKGSSVRSAKTVCRRCDVRKECLEYAINTGQRFGVWGGKSERERRSLRRAS